MSKILKILGKRGRVTLPYEMRIRYRFQAGDVLSFEDTGTEIVIRKETLCNCKQLTVDKGQMTVQESPSGNHLKELLDNLTTEEVYTALLHLTVKWAAEQNK